MSWGIDLEPAIAVLDIGKTRSKLSLWTLRGEQLAHRTYANQTHTLEGERVLDAEGIENWVIETLRGYSTQARIQRVIPVAHGAAAALVRNGRLVELPLDYEQPVSAEARRGYDAMRDLFSLTGSPALPNGLNLGVQLYERRSWITSGTRILLWPQYWSWRMSGVESSEVTSLGCHTDLWWPDAGRFSDLARSTGWADHFPPMHRAGEALGTVTEEWSARTGLGRDVQVHCGIHDSNAALVAARAFPEIRGKEATVLSTGTWFIAMRTPGADSAAVVLQEERDCLLNVDALGTPIPSARFMGGREMEILAGTDTVDNEQLLSALQAVVKRQAMAFPSFVPGVGPFPRRQGNWLNQPADKAEQRAAAGLYLAMMADVSLQLIGANERIMIEGRFSKDELFTRALAALRPRDAVYVSDYEADVAFGAVCLLNPALEPPVRLRQVEPIDMDLSRYHAKWKEQVEQ